MKPVLSKVTLLNGWQKVKAYDTVEGAILAFRRQKKARRLAERAYRMEYSLDRGTTWFKA